MSSKYSRDFIVEIDKAQLSSKKAEWEGKPSLIPYMLLRGDLLQWTIVVLLLLYLITENFLGQMVVIGIYLLKLIADIVSWCNTRYMIITDGPVVCRYGKYYLAPWEEIDKKMFRVHPRRLGCKTFTFGVCYKDSYKNNYYRKIGTFWQVKEYREVFKLCLKYLGDEVINN